MSQSFQFCPKCGTEFLVYQENNAKVMCGRCNFIYYFNVGAAVAAILEIEDEIVLAKRAHHPSKGKFDLPGGFVDFNETAEEAIIREVKEELGVIIQNPHYVCTFPNIYPFENNTYYTLDIVFRYRFDSKPHLSASDDVSDFTLVKKDKIPYSQIAFESLKKALWSCYKK